MSRVEAAEAYLSRTGGSNHSVKVRATSVSLSALRARSGLSLRQVEARSSVNRGRISELEHGHRVPTPDELAALAAAYDVAGEWRIVVQTVLVEYVEAES